MKIFNLPAFLTLTIMFPDTSSAFGTMPTGQKVTFAKYETQLKSATSDETDDAPVFSIPATTSSDVTPAVDKALVDELVPVGVLLHGGRKLRKEGLTGKGVKVAVIDSGVDADHPEFGDQVKQTVWYRRGTPLSRDDHGTHVAGTIHFMAPEADIYDYRVFGRYGRLDVNSAIARAIRSAVYDGCDLINLSLGAPRRDSRIYSAIQYANEAGVLMVAAAGNSGDDNILTNENMWPANSAETISIAAVSKRDGLPVAEFSNTNSLIDYAGIGVDVVSMRPGGSFQKMSGTSMACPHVCGLIAALMTKGGAYESQIKDDASLRALLTENFAIDIGTMGRDNATGLGFLSYLSKEEFEERFIIDLPDL
eukprot:CAMPEP_0204612538 /NCGR_PEP_ID=MMETSP0717-20131115/632_1 /ASSEMBLY_ACC=CAM_ASM_000666 /TAXON_ID=230516 /ORGANISM="Chaetoceros curvisetus" /LENGTH=364 /DNA_ID=CAMNT_0051624667 /DNA_START=51 /DNA_END=1145 /DNA_ORIENTATION=+